MKGKIINKNKWKKRNKKLVMCEMCGQPRMPINGFCSCGASLVPIDKI